MFTRQAVTATVVAIVVIASTIILASRGNMERRRVQERDALESREGTVVMKWDYASPEERIALVLNYPAAVMLRATVPSLSLVALGALFWWCGALSFVRVQEGDRLLIACYVVILLSIQALVAYGVVVAYMEGYFEFPHFWGGVIWTCILVFGVQRMRHLIRASARGKQ